jgi:ATP-dependent Clp protease ATP-binding subunit ClpC
MGDKVLGIQHVLLSVSASKFFDGIVDINHEDLKKVTMQISLIDSSGSNSNDSDDEDGFCSVSAHSSNQKKRKTKKAKEEILNSFFVDLTQKAIDGKLDPVIGRDTEIEQVITVLCRKRKSNPVLVGSAGVGKTAIVEGLAQRIACGAVPVAIKNKKIIALNLSSVVADTQFRGQFEEKMNCIIGFFKESPEYICFIDEMHTVLGAGSAIGTLDAGNILKPPLARGELKCIGATTEDEYYKFVSRDGALERRFQKVVVTEPNINDTKKIMYGIKESMEKHHSCKILDSAIESSVDLSDNYIRDRHFPDKAIDLIDDACARFANIKNEDKKEISIDKEHVARIISEQQHIPYDFVISSYAERVFSLDEKIGQFFVGQKDTLKQVCRIIKNSYVGMRSVDAPICSFMFVGQSGTGKTYLAEKISEIVFPNKEAFIRINMTEFTEQHSVAKLIGSPPGYVGFGEKNQLTDRVARRPYCLILIDEIDKAHHDVIRLFMQILSRGSITDAKGREISFRQTIIMMTTNIGFENGNSSGQLGFSNTENSAVSEKSFTMCKKVFGVEFVNRMNSIIVFNTFSEDEKRLLAKMFLTKISEKIKTQKNIDISYEDDIISVILSESKKHPGINANPIEDVVVKGYVPNIISDYIVEHKGNVKKIHMVAENGAIVVK